MALLCLVCVWHAIVPLIQSLVVDRLVLATFGCIYLLSHLAFYIFIYVVVSHIAVSSSFHTNSPLNRVTARHS